MVLPYWLYLLTMANSHIHSQSALQMSRTLGLKNGKFENAFSEAKCLSGKKLAILERKWPYKTTVCLHQTLCEHSILIDVLANVNKTNAWIRFQTFFINHSISCVWCWWPDSIFHERSLTTLCATWNKALMWPNTYTTDIMFGAIFPTHTTYYYRAIQRVTESTNKTN